MMGRSWRGSGCRWFYFLVCGGMKRIVFTIAYWKEKYTHMAEVLKKSIEKYSPNTEFKIFTDEHITKVPIFQQKDNWRWKIEICKNLNDPNTQYMFIDADSFVFCDLNPLFNCIEHWKIIISWQKSPHWKWDWVQELDFPLACKNAWIENDMKAYHLNSWFMIWQWWIHCFDKALEVFDAYTFDDWKWRRDDEYYINAWIQLTNTWVIPLQNQSIIPLKVYWVWNLSIRNWKLHSSKHKNQWDIQHYWGQNYENYFVKKIIHAIENDYIPENTNWYEYIRYNFLVLSYRTALMYDILSRNIVWSKIIKFLKMFMSR